MATLIDAAPTAAIPAGYPRELEREIRLQDGAAAQIRPIRPDDAERLIELYDRLSYTTAYQRFFRVLKRLPPEWARLFANVDYHGRLALVAQHDAPHGPELVGVARYEPSDEPGTVEVAVVVQDGWQGRGLGVMLLGDLLAAAEARGIHRFCAFVLADNSRMLDMLARFTRVQKRTIDSGVVEIIFMPRAQPVSA
ncbi:MAG: hypothetical protein AUG00_04135 [Candidatus Rokubacteria bacterium 13_1_20CM_2_70_7]|nr:MAG: hypothetical protein AUG00_04135 [Candidatus Rokubacteria bacterium 13_1_20CM_2_70_7]